MENSECPMGKVHFLPPTEGKFAKARESLNKHVLDPDRGSEGKWQSLIENFPDIILTVTRDGTITFINHTMPGLTPEQVSGTKVYDYIPTNDHEKIRKSLERVFQTGETVNYETSGIGPQDTASCFMNRVGPVLREGEVVAAILVATDMTVRNRVEKEIQRKSHDYGERVKELNCLYKASQMMAERDITRDEVLNRLIELIPSACQFPEITCTRIILYGREFKSENFKKTKWKLSVDITLSGSKIGSMEVYYLEEKPEADEGPFHKEEKNLLENLARETEKFIERKQVDEEIRNQSKLLQTAIDAITNPFYIINVKDFTITLANKVAGFDLSKGLSTCYALTHGRSSPCEGDHPCPLVEIKRTKKPITVEHLHLDKNGNLRDLEVYAFPIFNEDGDLVQVIEQNVDITERKQTEEALRESEEQLRGLVENAPVGIYRTTSDGKILILNPELIRMLGYSSVKDLISRNVEKDSLMPETYKNQFKEQIERDGEIKGLESQWFRKDGSEIFVRESARCIRDEKGNVQYYEGIVEDITEQKKLEEQFRQSQKMEGIGRLAGGVAHDFNNLLTVISGHTELAMTTLDTQDPLRDDLQEILNAAGRAADLTGQLLSFSRKQIQQPKVLNLNDIITELHKMLRRIIGEDIHLETIPEPDLGSVNADPGQIEQIIVNLAVNARDAMPDGGKLTIETQNVELDEEYARVHHGATPGSYVMLAVSDTGHGMTEDVRMQIFDPFFTTKREGEGTGLGLSTVYGIVKQSGGSIWAYSELGEGTTFKIYLPRKAAKAEKFVREVSGIELPCGSETVLVVEDEEGVRNLVIRVLKGQGYTVMKARTGDEAYLMCQKLDKPVDLVITDVIMPVMGGAELAEKLRELWSEDIKVLYMSGYTANAIVHKGVLAPDIPYIQKPFRPVDIAWKVRRVLDGK